MDKEIPDATISNYSFEAKQNLVGFFSLLLDIDKRQHPERYKRSNENIQPDSAS